MPNVSRIAITMGEPGGIGPEVIAKALYSIKRVTSNYLVIGSASVMEDAVELASLPLNIRTISVPSASEPGSDIIEVINVGATPRKRKAGPSAGAGSTVVKYIKKAVKLAMKRELDAIVTGPISKESLSMAGCVWPGHTEMLAELTRSDDFGMMFVSKRMKVVLCTIHVPLREVPGKINEGLVLKTIRLAGKGGRMLGIRRPRIGVAGLNPHSGESGIMGDEEIKSIIPAVRRAAREGMDVAGPYPPDVIFHKAYNGDFDIVVCMYHDQGLIPFKMLSFDKGVNVTVGLPFVRTSPDHGTAFDIAWKNTADPSSMIEALKLASIMSRRTGDNPRLNKE